MTESIDIGGASYGPEELVDLRQRVMVRRDAALGPEVFDASAAVELSHVIAALFELGSRVWGKKFTNLAAKALAEKHGG